MSYDNKKFLDANGVTQIVGLLDDYATNETLSTVVNSVQSALDQKVDDVQIDGTSILNNGAANIPVAGPNQLGVLKVGSGTRGVNVSSTTDELQINFATAVLIKSGVNTYCPITPKYVDAAAFYGLASAAGKSMSSVSGATVGVYPDEQKQAILKMLGLDGILGDFESSAVASKTYAIGETFVYNGKRYRVTADIAQGYVINPGTNCELDPIDGHYVRDTDKATTQKRGLVKIDPNFGIALRDSPYEDVLMINRASDNEIKTTEGYRKPIVPVNQHKAVFYGLAKVAGDTTQSQSDNAVGTYTAEAKAAILAMLGANGNGLQILNGTLATDSASTASIKNAANSFAPIVSSHIHDAAFFGLAKAAGADMASLSDVTVGQYPQAQKTAIQTMLGIEASVPLIENVSGTAPTIVGMPNIRYICGEVTLLTITPPAAGSIVVRFSTGSSTTLTVPDTVKWPAWFDATSLNANTTYEIIITDGVYGGVMSWA